MVTSSCYKLLNHGVYFSRGKEWKHSFPRDIFQNNFTCWENSTVTMEGLSEQLIIITRNPFKNVNTTQIQWIQLQADALLLSSG